MSEPVSEDDDSHKPDSESVNRSVAEIEPNLESLPMEERAQVIEVLEQHLSHSGPLPTPEQLVQYDQALPGLAERIVQMTEREQSNRHLFMKTLVDRQAGLKDRGQWLGFAALVILLGFCTYLASLGDTKAASVVAIGVIAAVVGIFVIGKWGDRQERADDNSLVE